MDERSHCLPGPSKGETFSEWRPQILCLNHNNPIMILSSGIDKAFSYPSSQLFQRTLSSFFLSLPSLWRIGELERPLLTH